MKRSMKVLGLPGAILLALLSAGGYTYGKDTSGLSKEEFAQKTQRMQLPFIANEGQADIRVSFYANTFGGTVLVTKTGEIIYSLPQSGNREDHLMKGTADIHHYALCRLPQAQKTMHLASPLLTFLDTIIHHTSSAKGLILKEELVGGRSAGIQGEDTAETVVSYFKGNDPSQWRSSVATYGEVNLGEIYRGIELRLKAYGNNVEKLFCVKPDTRPEQIQIDLRGAQSLRVNAKGELEAETELGKVSFTKPVAFQEINGKRIEVDVEYRIQKPEAGSQNTEERLSQLVYGFQVASYDTTKDLIIDPLLASTFLGGSGYDVGSSLAIDAGGNVYVTGYTYDAATDLPATPGVYDTTHNGGADVFVSKFNSGLTNLLASTFLGGSGYDYGYSLAIDAGGNIYVTGYTYNAATDLPATPGAYDTTHNGGADAFVSEFNSGLTSLLASTYLGGSGSDYGYSLAIDAGGNVYVTGYTFNAATDLPVTPGAYDTSHNGGADVFVSEFNSGLTNLLASTYLGGSSDDWGNSLAIDGRGNVYVTGYTYDAATHLPATPGAYDTSHNGANDAFVSKFNSGLTSLLASTYLGGSSDDFGISLAIDAGVYVTGSTWDAAIDFPTTPGAYDTTHNGGADTFVFRLDSNLSKNIWHIVSMGGSNAEGTFTSLGLTSTNRACISYYDASKRNLRYGYNIPGGSWKKVTPDSTGLIGKYTSLAVKKSNDRVYISYYDQTNGDLKLATNDTPTGAWNISTVDSTGNVGLYTSIAQDSTGKVSISYYDQTNGDLKCASTSTPLNPASWVITTVDSAGNVGQYTSLAIDSLNHVHVSYYDSTNGDLKYALYTDSWSTEAISNALEANVGQYSSLGIDSSDNVHISYYDLTNRQLLYANNVGNSWVSEVVDSAGSVGLYTSLAMDASHNVHISYYDATNGDLKYANNASGSWIRKRVDSAGRVGEYTSIKTDAKGFVHISYYDRSNQDMRYARSLVPYGVSAAPQK